MEITDIREKLRIIFDKVFQSGNLEITDDLTAEKVTKWDSLSHLTMIAEVESVFGIKFKLKELVSMKNVGDLIQLIISKTG
jgi:acyl carrier protein